VTRDCGQRDLSILPLVMSRCLGTGWLWIFTVGIGPMDGVSPSSTILDDGLDLDRVDADGLAHD